MPLPMVHLAVAVQLAEKVVQQPSSTFLLGSIAPDDRVEAFIIAASQHLQTQFSIWKLAEGVV